MSKKSKTGNPGMKKVEGIEIINGEKVFNLAADEANIDWIRAARLLKAGDPESLAELKRMEEEPVYYRTEEQLAKFIVPNKQKPQKK